MSGLNSAAIIRRAPLAPPVQNGVARLPHVKRWLLPTLRTRGEQTEMVVFTGGASGTSGTSGTPTPITLFSRGKKGHGGLILLAWFAMSFATVRVLPAQTGTIIRAAEAIKFPGEPSLVAPIAGTSTKPAAVVSSAVPGASVDQLQSFIVQLAKMAIPEKYENTKHWGKQKSVPRGVRITRVDGRLKVRSRSKKLNHGSWYFYRITLDNPQDLELRLDDIKTLDNGEFSFSLFAEAPITTFARHAQWQWGAQLWSVHIDIDARVRVRADCTVEVQLNPTKLPPDVVLKPKVHNVDIELLSFKLRRFSQLGSDITEPLSHTVRELIEDELEDRRDELSAKINRQLEKKKDKLRLSLHDIMRSKWKSLMPAADKPESDKPESDKPESDKPAADVSAADVSAADKPAADKPAADKPAADKPASAP